MISPGEARRRGLRRRGRSRPRGGRVVRLGRLADEHHEAILVHGGEDAAHERVGRAATHVAKERSHDLGLTPLPNPHLHVRGVEAVSAGRDEVLQELHRQGKLVGRVRARDLRVDQRSPSASGAPNSGRSCRRDPCVLAAARESGITSGARGAGKLSDASDGRTRAIVARQLKLFPLALRTTLLSNFSRRRTCDIFHDCSPTSGSERSSSAGSLSDRRETPIGDRRRDFTSHAQAIMSAALLSSSISLRATPVPRINKARAACLSAPPPSRPAPWRPPFDTRKKLVGYKSVDDHVESGMVVGLGTGSTAYFAVERLGQKLESGELKDIIAIPTSERTREQAESLNIPLCTLNEKSVLDVAIDGADEVDPDLALVKGGGGALLREKMVEVMAKKFVVIVDESKLCKGLGPGFPLPVEITPFCHMHTLRTIADLPSVKGCEAVLRMGSSSTNKPDGDEIAVTDNGNYIVDLHFKEPIADVNKAAEELKNTVGVVDHGLFVGMSYQVIVAGSDGIKVAGTDGEKAWW